MVQQMQYDYTATPDQFARRVRECGKVTEVIFAGVPLENGISDSYTGMVISDLELIKWALAHPNAVRGGQHYKNFDEALERMKAGTAHPIEVMFFIQHTMLTSNGDTHKRIRKAYRKWVAPRFMRNEFAAEIRQIMDELLNEFEQQLQQHDRADFKSIVAQKLPMMVTCRLLGMSLERSNEIAGYVVSIFTGTDSAALAKLLGCVKEVIDAEELGEGILKDLLKDDTITGEEIINSSTQFITGGFDTTMGLLTSIVKMLIQQPEWLELIAAGRLSWEAVIEEALRRYAPAPLLPVVYFDRDMEVDGTVYAQGTPFIMAYHAAHLDDAHWNESETFNPMRTEGEKHIAFGYGAHRCIGEHVARTEVKIGLEMFFERFPDLTSAWKKEEEVAPILAIMAQQPASLPLKSVA